MALDVIVGHSMQTDIIDASSIYTAVGVLGALVNPADRIEFEFDYKVSEVEYSSPDGREAIACNTNLDYPFASSLINLANSLGKLSK